MRTALAFAALALLALDACSAPPPAPPALDPAKLVDLTYSFSHQTVYWPNAKGFEHRKDGWSKMPEGFWYAAGGFAADEHGGTHLDSPIHFAEGKEAVDQIPVARLAGPAAVIDVMAKAAKDRDYRVTREDVLAWEAVHGRISEGAIVVIRTGWGQYWPDRKQYLGSDVPGDTQNLHFPGLSREAAELLVERRIAGAGIDTASLDYGPSRDFIVHQILNRAGIYGLENIARAERLPATGATILALPMKIENGSGAPARIVALLP